MELAASKKVYFLSDFHLGAPNEKASRVREEHIVRFLQTDLCLLPTQHPSAERDNYAQSRLSCTCQASGPQIGRAHV